MKLQDLYAMKYVCFTVVRNYRCSVAQSGDNGFVVFLQALSYSSSRHSQVYGKVSICCTAAAILSVVLFVIAYIIVYVIFLT